MEDWIETCVNIFSQDLKRLISYSLRSFRLNHKNVEFTRSMDYDFFRFSTVLLLKLMFRCGDGLIRSVYLSKEPISKVGRLLQRLISFLFLRVNKEDLVLKRSINLTRLFLRVFCLTFYQIPLYNHIVKPLRIDLFSLLKLKPYISILGSENKNVTSIFISRFLARKLAQKYK